MGTELKPTSEKAITSAIGEPLHPFEKSQDKSVSVKFSCWRIPSRIEFVFEVHCKDLTKLILPSVSDKALRKDELWKSTCFEIFLSPTGQNSYYELNLSPAGHWNLYRFLEYRKIDKEFHSGQVLLNQRLSLSEQSLAWSGTLSGLDLLNNIEAELELGVTTVLEYQNKSIEYWAIKHTGQKPDFHRRDSFFLKL